MSGMNVDYAKAVVIEHMADPVFLTWLKKVSPRGHVIEAVKLLKAGKNRTETVKTLMRRYAVSKPTAYAWANEAIEITGYRNG